MTAGQRLALALGLVVVGGIVVAFWKKTTKARFIAALPAAGQPFGAFLWSSAREHGVPPALLAAVVGHESGFGAYLSPRGPGGTGDEGHGRGLSQIDDRTWGAWLLTHDWQDPATNIDKGAEILAAALKAFPGNTRAGIAAYNAGPGNVRRALARGADPASVTTHDKQGRSYVVNVTIRLQELQARAA